MTAMPNKNYTTDIVGPQQPKNTWKRDLEKEMGSRFQVQLDEDGGSSTGQSWMGQVVCGSDKAIVK